MRKHPVVDPLRTGSDAEHPPQEPGQQFRCSNDDDLHATFLLLSFSHPSQSQQDHGQGGEEHDDADGQHHGQQQTHSQGDDAQATLPAAVPTSTTTQKNRLLPILRTAFLLSTLYVRRRSNVLCGCPYLMGRPGFFSHALNSLATA